MQLASCQMWPRTWQGERLSVVSGMTAQPASNTSSTGNRTQYRFFMDFSLFPIFSYHTKLRQKMQGKTDIRDYITEK
jgi:hypothetical protein